MNSSLSYQNYYCIFCEKIAFHPYKAPCLKTICDKCLLLQEEVYQCKYCFIQHKKEDTKLNLLKREKIKLVQSSTKKSPSKSQYNTPWTSTYDYTHDTPNDINIEPLVIDKRKKRSYKEMLLSNHNQPIWLSSSILNGKDSDDDDINRQLDLLTKNLESNDPILQYGNNKEREITVGDQYISSVNKKKFKY